MYPKMVPREPPKDAAPKTKMIRNATKKHLVHCLWGALWCAIWLPEIRIAWGGLTGTSHRALARLKGNHTLASLFPQGLPASHTSFIFEPIRACWEHQLTNHCNAIEKVQAAMHNIPFTLVRKAQTKMRRQGLAVG